jgi:hypothetical protein
MNHEAWVGFKLVPRNISGLNSLGKCLKHSPEVMPSFIYVNINTDLYMQIYEEVPKQSI